MLETCPLSREGLRPNTELLRNLQQVPLGTRRRGAGRPDRARERGCQPLPAPHHGPVCLCSQTTSQRRDKHCSPWGPEAGGAAAPRCQRAPPAMFQDFEPRRAHPAPTAPPWRSRTEASLFLPHDSCVPFKREQNRHVLMEKVH